MKKAFKGTVSVLKEDGRDYGESCYLYFKKWEKYGKSRIYMNDYKGRTVGYIENGEYHQIDNQGNSKAEIETALKKFRETYEF